MVRMHKQYVNGELVKEIPYTFREELVENTDNYFHTISHNAFPSGMPTTIEEYKERLDIEAALNQTFLDYGVTQGEIDSLPKPVKKALATFMKVVILAVWKTQGNIPGAEMDS